VLPGIHVGTADVYRAWKKEDVGRFPSGADAELVTCHTAAEMSSLLSNQLEPAVFRVAPQLHQLRDAVQQLLTAPVRVSGSGSSMYVLFDDPQQAAAAAAKVQAQLPHIKTVAARAPVGEGPVIRVS
jgi:4-diphosphocytidyl-2C-methyl-D-erythritol kinase